MPSIPQRLRPEGIPLKVDNTTRLVTGLTKQTTCSDVIKMALKKTGTDNKDNHYMYYIIQSSNGSETKIPERSRILSVLKNSTDNKINFILRKRKSVSITKYSGSSMSLTEVPSKRQCRNRLKFNTSLDELDDTGVKVLKITKLTSAAKAQRQDVADLAKFVQSQMTMLTQQCDNNDAAPEVESRGDTGEQDYVANDTFSHEVLFENTADFFDPRGEADIMEHKQLPVITKDKPAGAARHCTPVHNQTLNNSTNRSSPRFRTSLPFKKLSKLSKACLRTPSYKLEKSTSKFRFLQRRNSKRLNNSISHLQHSESQRSSDLSNTSMTVDSGFLDITRELSSKDVNGNCKKQPNFLDNFLMDTRYKRQAVSEQLNRKFVDYEQLRSNCLDGSYMEQTDDFTGRFDVFKNMRKERRGLVNDGTGTIQIDQRNSVNVGLSSTGVKRTNTFNKQKDGEDLSDYIKRIFAKPTNVDEDAYMESFM